MDTPRGLNTAMILLIAASAGWAQDMGPLANSRTLNTGRGSPSIVLLTASLADTCVQRVYGVNTLDYSLTPALSYRATGGMGIDSTRELDMVTGDFDADGHDEIATLWEGVGCELKLMISKMYKSFPSWPLSLACVESTGVAFIHRDPADPRWSRPMDPWHVQVLSGNFDDDPQKELLVSYWSESGKLVLRIYNIRTAPTTRKLIPELMTADSTESLDESLGESARFDVAVGNFDADSLDEIALIAVHKLTATRWTPYLRSFDVTPTGIVAGAIRDSLWVIDQTPYTLGDGEGYQWEHVCAEAGDLNGDGRDEIVTLHQVGGSEWRDGFLHVEFYKTVGNHLSVYSTIDNMSRIDSSAAVLWTRDWAYTGIWAFAPGYVRLPERHTGIATGDLNLDGSDEILWARDDRLLVLESLSLAERTSKPIIVPSGGGKSTMCIADLDTVGTPGGGEIPEVVVADWDSSGRVRIFQPSLSGSQITDLIESYSTTNLGFSGAVAAAIGDFDGGLVTLGTPSHFSVTDIVQPLVVLNAPPVHFDVFNGVAYDVCRSFNQNTSQFTSTFTKTSENSSEVEVQTTSDWGVSAGLDVSYTSLCWSVKGSLEVQYGERFSKVSGSSHTEKISTGTEAWVDDQIYASTMRYDVWEYPLYLNSMKAGSILVVEPAQQVNTWFPSKSWTGHSYVPDHEVGNILSYRAYPSLGGNPFLEQKIKGDYVYSYVISTDGAYDWGLNYGDFQNAGVSSQKELAIQWGVQGEYWGVAGAGLYEVQAKIEGSYSSEEIQTERTGVASDLNIAVHLATIDASIGPVSYTITPYAYWGTNGAIVVDYAVQPAIAPAGHPPTWWQLRYGGKPDPAFILPWRLDPEKGYPVDPAMRSLTKDLLFFPPSPKVGDTVTTIARVHNFSLVPTPAPIGVRFFVGDPDSSGVPIVGLGGVTEVFTDSAIAERGTRTVRFRWIVPPWIGRTPRIYAVIDVSASLEEIHEDNNKGWKVLGTGTSLGVDNRAGQSVPGAFALFPNYPNPFNPMTTIRYGLPASSPVTLTIFNVLGQQVASLIEGKKEAGYHEVKFDGGGLSSGVYFYRLQAGDFVQTRKMVVVK